MGWGRADYWFPQIRSLGGAIVVMSLVLYPYVYLLARAAFLEQCTCMLDVSRTLGRGPWSSFFEVAVPLARPAIAGGVALALMEALADFGTVQYFGVNTFTTGIYRTWFALGEPVGGGAARRGADAADPAGAGRRALVARPRRLPAHRPVASAAELRSARRLGRRGLRCAASPRSCWASACRSLVLLRMALARGDALFGGLFLELAWNSFTLAAIAAVLTAALAIVVAYALRLRPTPLMRAAARVAGLGYAIPGAVIAIGVLIPFARLDNALDAWLRAHLGISTGLVLTGTIAGLVFAYLVRFLALALNTVEAGLGKINRHLDDAARTLGRGPGGTLVRVHVPLIWGSVLTAVILVFVDVLKELPATLILRPFNFETLAVRVYRFAADERLAEASTAALAIVRGRPDPGDPAQPGDRPRAARRRDPGPARAAGEPRPPVRLVQALAAARRAARARSAAQR